MSPREGYLEPDRDQLAIFVEALFPYASEGGTVSLRGFYDDKRSGTFGRYPVTLDGAGIEPVVRKAVKLATEALAGKRPVVVAPIPSTFTPGGRAEENNIFEGLALVVDIDKSDPAKGLTDLRHTGLTKC